MGGWIVPVEVDIGAVACGSTDVEAELRQFRGVLRPTDLDTTNSVASARIAQMEVQVNGKGIVNDAVRRPFFLYRLLLGLLPF